MDEKLKEELKEISAELYTVKVAAREVSDPDIIDNALFAIIKHIDRLVEEQ